MGRLQKFYRNLQQWMWFLYRVSKLSNIEANGGIALVIEIIQLDCEEGLALGFVIRVKASQ
jgi:hypothetical protein